MSEREVEKKYYLFHPIVVMSLSILLVGLTVYFFMAYNYGISEDTSFDDFRTDKVSSAVKIHVNINGIPFIQAQNEDDILFSMGYVHAKDRLWQMEFNRRIIDGRLSEILGVEYVQVDKFMRSLDLNLAAKDIYQNLPTGSKNILKHYADGVNEYITKNDKNLPFEFGAFDIKPEKWKPEDCIKIHRLFAIKQSVAMWFELFLANTAEKIGRNKALDLLPNYPENMPIQFLEKQNVTYEEFMPIIEDTLVTDKSEVAYTIRDDRDEFYFGNGFNLNEVMELLIFNPTIDGCNLWITKKDMDSPNSPVILSNDLHSSMTLPAPWYMMQYQYSGDLCSGYSLPGFPFLFSGRNEKLSWGITSMRTDDADFYIVEVDSTGEFYKNANDSLVTIQLERDTIAIAGLQPHVYFQKKVAGRKLLQGKIFDKYSVNAISKSSEIFRKYGVIVNLDVEKFSDEVDVLSKISKASNKVDFENIIKNWKYPNLVWGMGDRDGNYGLYANFKKKIDSLEYSFPLDIGILEMENKCGLRSEDQMSSDIEWNHVQIVNDSNSFLVSANNKLFSSDSLITAKYWANWARAKRISDVLIASDYFDATDAKILQTDIYSSYTEEILNICIPVWNQNKQHLNDKQIEALELLEKWDFIFSSVSVEASIFVSFMDRLLYNTFADELGEELYLQYMDFPDYSYGKIYELLTVHQSSHWFDNIDTEEEQENAYYLIFVSLMEGVNSLIMNFESSDIFDWRYEYLHQIQVKHNLSNISKIQAAYPVKNYPMGGHHTTITNSHSHQNSSYGASARFIADMSEEYVYYAMPGGQSGNPVSVNFDDQFDFWQNNTYYTLPIYLDEEDSGERVINIRPK